MIRIIGPKDRRDATAINTTSHSKSEWTTQLSPFNLGPTNLYGNLTAQIFENAWQYAKVYPQHVDQQGNPTNAYWSWAKTGWNSKIPRRYPMGKGTRPLYSLWNNNRLDYIEARKTIYLPLYRDLVKQTDAFRRLQQIYQHEQKITLFDFDGYDYLALKRTLSQVLHDPTRICGHAFVLAMMLEYGPDFTVADLENVTETSEDVLYPIEVVNVKNFKGPYEYIGRPMPNRPGSPLGNPFKVKPHSPYPTAASTLDDYKNHLWKLMRDTNSPAFIELIRLMDLAKEAPLNIGWWCAPGPCHGEVVRSALTYLANIKIQAITANPKTR